jgi:hypothetical protein
LGLLSAARRTARILLSLKPSMTSKEVSGGPQTEESLFLDYFSQKIIIVLLCFIENKVLLILSLLARLGTCYDEKAILVLARQVLNVAFPFMVLK